MRYKILNILALVTLASCTETIYIEKDAEKSPYLNGECKTPIAVGISYNEGSVQTRATRATNGSFTQNDNLIAYFRHVTATETTTGGKTSYSAIAPVSGEGITGVGPTMANMTVGTIVDGSKDTEGNAKADNYTESGVTKLTLSPTLYWDDFSNSNVADGAADLRTSEHYLQSYYGYCYNGAATSSYSLTESTGELSWTIETDQNTNGLTKSDLLWSSSQDPVPYAHATFNGGVEHGKLTIPYSHAMSKVTIEVNCDESFTKTAAVIFNETSIDLINMYSTAKVTAPTQAILATDSNNNTITMKKNSISEATATEKKKSSYEAIIIPIKLTNDLLFATIKDVDGNNYDIKITEALLSTAPTGEKTWNSELNNGSTKSGVNYKLVVTISKQEIKVVATIADWTTVEAAAEGEINFTTDVAGATENKFTTKFDLYSKSAITTTETYYSNVLNNNRNTVCTWDVTKSKWIYSPTLYWEKEGDNRYFRAVSPQVNDRAITPISDNPQTVIMTAGEGTGFDFCWGTSQAYKNSRNQDVTEGDPVEPRTSNVGLQFYHKTSKVKIVLQTPPTDAEGKVDIRVAKIQLTNLYTTNTVNLHTGVISAFTESSSRSGKVFIESTTATEDKRPIASTYTPGSAATESNPAVDDKAESSELFMIPQEIPSDDASTANVNEEARLIITLTDGTTYSLALNSCKTVVKDVNGEDQYVPVDKWEEGKSYVYYIRLTKEEIQFIALIQNWDEKETNGSATMDWDDVDPDLFEGGLIEKRGDGWKIQ